MGSRWTESPDGRRWEVRIHRIRLPAWHQSAFEPEDHHSSSMMVLEHLVLAPLFWFVFPLLRSIVLLPVAVARSLFSSTRWVEAVCKEPGEIKIIWRTHRAAANRVAEEIASRLKSGYEELTPPEAEFVSMTEPAGVDDLHA